MNSSTKKRTITRPGHIIGLAALFVIAPSLGGQYQTHDSIRQEATRFVLASDLFPNEKMTVRAGRLDRRLRLSQCSRPLEAFAPNRRKNTHKLTIGIRCNDNPGWSLYVPTTISVKKPILVAASDLKRGTILHKGNLVYRVHDIARLPRGYVDRLELAIGKQLKSQLRSNTPLTPSKMVAPLSVKRNSQVTILADIGSIQVRMNGKALSSGATGERVRVRNNSSKREVEGIVIAPGVVRVTM